MSKRNFKILSQNHGLTVWKNLLWSAKSELALKGHFDFASFLNIINLFFLFYLDREKIETKLYNFDVRPWG